jgi:hypothetical protein
MGHQTIQGTQFPAIQEIEIEQHPYIGLMRQGLDGLGESGDSIHPIMLSEGTFYKVDKSKVIFN